MKNVASLILVTLVTTNCYSQTIKDTANLRFINASTQKCDPYLYYFIYDSLGAEKMTNSLAFKKRYLIANGSLGLCDSLQLYQGYYVLQGNNIVFVPDSTRKHKD